jgi:hypothetical protein
MLKEEVGISRMLYKFAIEIDLKILQHTLKVGNGDGVSIRGFLNPVSDSLFLQTDEHGT